MTVATLFVPSSQVHVCPSETLTEPEPSSAHQILSKKEKKKKTPAVLHAAWESPSVARLKQLFASSESAGLTLK